MQTKDMTTGSPAGLILRFALPLMLGNVFQQFYTFVDTMVVGQALGVKALAALGAAEWLTFLMFGLVQGLVQGFSLVMARQFGAGDDKGLKKAVAGAVWLSLSAAVLFTALGQLMLRPVLQLLRTPAEIIDLTLIYLRILYASLPVAFAYNLLAALLRALGNSKTPLQAMTLSSFCNIALDLLFVFGFGWGIQGAAAATVLAQLLAACFCCVKLRGSGLFSLGNKEYYPDRDVIKEQLKLGLPMGLQNMITAMGGLIVQSVINGFGVLFIAGYTAANKLYGLLEIAASSYGYAMSTYSGQNMGAARYDRIGKGLRAANLIGAATALLMSAIMVFFGKPVLGCFLTGDSVTVEGAMRIGYHFLLVLAVFFPFLYILYVTRSCIQGMGNSLLPMISSIVQLVMRTGCALLLPALIGESGVFYGEVCAWLGADLLLAFSYFYCMKKLRTAAGPAEI
ncbi:MATE family efflux transporter [Eisenbergiella tayi]|uniref:Probable multidrug resistance protein NorM n=1 Tax=Eisenbergiella tayi TaxID=1432052 RepID=A0A1E3AIU3_9FIRM|nr:MATE family efflux transporter [Eisenbergiella tayi]ODM08658.1 Multidrug export protein MepA [Eisenbergiella tayi]